MRLLWLYVAVDDAESVHVRQRLQRLHTPEHDLPLRNVRTVRLGSLDLAS